MRMAPGACGEAPEAGGSEEESGRRDGRPQVADASQTRKAPDFCHREAQQDGGVLLPDSLLLNI